MRPLQILETALYVDDLQAAEQFYTHVLGLELDSKKDGRHAFLRISGQMLLLFDPDHTINVTGRSPAHGAKGPGHIAFAVDESELETWKKHLQSHGVSIESEVDWPQGGHSIYFRDPAGNSLEFTTAKTWK